MKYLKDGKFGFVIIGFRIRIKLVLRAYSIEAEIWMKEEEIRLKEEEKRTKKEIAENLLPHIRLFIEFYFVPDIG